MIKKTYKSNGRPCVISLELYSDQRVKVNITAFDTKRRNTKYLDRYHTFKGNKKFVIRMPQSPKVVGIAIKYNNDANVKIVKKDVLPLQTQMSSWDYQEPVISKFVIFTQQFADVAGYLSEGKYFDDTGTYNIEYVPYITNEQTGIEINTPARINSSSGRVQASQKMFRKYTIPARVAILLHEFCHVFKNGNMHDELEADFHAANIYCALGYPRVEILNVFANIFYKADNELNRTRLSKLRDMIDNYDTKIEKVRYGI